MSDTGAFISIEVLLHGHGRTGILVYMQKQALADRLNLIANLFHLGSPPADKPAVCDVFGADLEYPLSLIGEARQQFQSSVDDLLNFPTPCDGHYLRRVRCQRVDSSNTGKEGWRRAV